MKQYNIITSVVICTEEELTAKDRELVLAAQKAVATSYAPYSKFSVGAALRLTNDVIFTGSNQENAAYPSGLCAERTALFASNAHYPECGVKALAIAAFNKGEFTALPIVPCGACRQVMIEVEQRFCQPMKVLLYGKKCIYVIESAKDLMPLSFTNESLL